MRSQSFRGDTVPTSLPLVSSSANPLSPGETAPDIYRKHVARIEELEKENKRLSREASDANKRWKKAEEDLAARDEDTDSEDDSDNEELKEVISKLVCSVCLFFLFQRTYCASQIRILWKEVLIIILPVGK